RANLEAIKSTIVLTSARGGVGKSALTVSIAAALAQSGRKAVLFDADLNSPSLHAMLGMKTPRRLPLSDAADPATGPLGLRVVTVNVALEPAIPLLNLSDAEILPATENGSRPASTGYAATLSRTLAHTRLGAADLLLIDAAPGLEACSRILELVPEANFVVVSHPARLAAQATQRMLEFLASKRARVLGLVENMVGFNCDGCHAVRPLLPHGAMIATAVAAGVSILDRLPFDPRLAETNDRGALFIREYADTPLAKQIVGLAQSLERSALTRDATAPRDDRAVPGAN